MPNPPTAQQLINQVRASLNESRPDYAAAPSAHRALDALAALFQEREDRIRELEAVQDRLVDLWQGPIRIKILNKLNATEASVFNELGALVRASVEVRQAAQLKELLNSIVPGSTHD